MKVESLHLRNFKRFHEFDIEFKNRLVDEIADRFLILGDNGSGKTTILQAMALVLSLISSKCTSFEDFPWQGWVPGRFMRWGNPRIEVIVHFSAEENQATRELAKPFHERFVDKDKHPYVEPPDHRIVKVILEGARYRTEPRDARFQFYGRGYAAQLVDAGETWVHGHFDKLPGIFWFDQFRSLTVPPADESDGRSTRVSAGNGGRHRRTDEDGSLTQQPFLLRGAELRQYLNSWKLAKLSNAPIKYIDELEGLYSRVFPERSFDDGEIEFRGTTPTPDNTYFLLKDITNGKTYDVEEMSSGEQSVFPILYEFVRRRISNSIIMIDEIDLNLHPPHAQALLTLLPELGANCQFFLTTHSRSITSVVSPHEVLRLPGGQPCL